MTLTYPDGAAILEGFVVARVAHDGDAWTACFSDDADVRLDPFAAALVGHNALRAYLEEAAEAETLFELTIERHWVSGDLILASWHAAWTPPGTRVRGRLAGFLTAEVRAGLIVRYRQWWNAREPLAG